MQEFIAEKLDNIYKGFQRSAKTAGGLCELKEFTYQHGRLPNYTSGLARQWYLLRYLPAYLAEYRLIYGDVLGQKFLRQPLNALSIGCGCGVDYWGLHFAVTNDYPSYASGLRYTGLDIVDWGYWDGLGREEAWLLKCNVLEWDRLDEEDYNLIVFPKSIGEFSFDVFQHVLRIFAATRFRSNRIALVGSFRQRVAEADRKRLVQLVNVMTEQHGFRCLDDTGDVRDWGSDVGINALCSAFVYPKGIMDAVSTALNCCPKYRRNGKACQSDCNDIPRKPILRAGYMRWMALRLCRPSAAKGTARARKRVA